MSNVLFNKQETLNTIKTIALRGARPVDIQDKDGVLTMTLSDGSVVGWCLDTLGIVDEVAGWDEKAIHDKLSGFDESILSGFITTSVVDGETHQQFLGDLTIADFNSLNHIKDQPGQTESNELREKGHRLFTMAFVGLIKREYDRLKDRMVESTQKYWSTFIQTMERSLQATAK